MSGSRTYYVSRRYTIYLRFEGGEALVWDERLSNALNVVGKEKSPSRAYAAIFERGVEAVEAEMRDGGESHEDSEVAQALEEIRKAKERKRRLAELYESMGLDQFVGWCEERGIDWEGFLDEYQLFRQSEPQSWSEKASSWLRDFLRDGERHHTDEIKEAAIAKGIIDHSDDHTFKRDWGKLRQVAHREGLTTGEKGCWQYKPKPF
jgi:hypothetical protein